MAVRNIEETQLNDQARVRISKSSGLNQLQCLLPDEVLRIERTKAQTIQRDRFCLAGSAINVSPINSFPDTSNKFDPGCIVSRANVVAGEQDFGSTCTVFLTTEAQIVMAAAYPWRSVPYSLSNQSIGQESNTRCKNMFSSVRQQGRQIVIPSTARPHYPRIGARV